MRLMAVHTSICKIPLYANICKLAKHCGDIPFHTLERNIKGPNFRSTDALLEAITAFV